MSLFSKLLSLHSGITPEENFFTEVFVAVLSRNKELLREFLHRFFEYSEEYYSSRVESQVSLSRLEGHESGSRPDVVIELFNGESDTYDLILIESKLGSLEGPNQLARYAEHLAVTFSGARNRYLVYITRNFDPKDWPKVTGRVGERIIVKTIRWSQFYSLLQDFRQDSLLDEMAIYMEENGMTEKNKLLPTDLSAMTAFPRLIDFMQSSLEGEVEQKFKAVLGCKPRDLFGMQARSEGRVIWWHEINRDWAFGVGYFFDEGGREYPSIGLLIEIDPKSSHWQEIAPVLKQVADDLNEKAVSWQIFDLEHPENWTRLLIQESIANILANSDHLLAIRKRLLWYLDQVEAIKKRYPSLPWNSD